MSLLARKKAIYLALETTYGIEEAIVAADVVDTENLTIRAIDGPTVQRNRDRPQLGGDKRIRVGEFVSFSFDVPLAGSGTATTAPKYSRVLEICGFAAPAVGASSVVMGLIGADDAWKSGTLFFEHDGQQHKILGARASTQWQLSPGGLPRIQVQGQGLFVSPTSVAGLTPDYTGWEDEIAINEANVPTLTLHGESLVMSALSVNQNAQVAYRNVVNGEEVIGSDWDFTGQITFDAPEISVKDWFAVSRAATSGVFQMIIGAVAGAICQIDGAAVQLLLQDTYSESPEGVSQLTGDLFFTNETAEEDFVLTTS